MQKWNTIFSEEKGLISNYVILENVADERGEPAAKVARTLVRLGCDLYLRFGPSREPYIGENFFPEHPTVEMKYKIDPGDYTLTKESQEVVIKRLGRGDFTTLGLLVWIYTKVDSSITVPYQIELMEEDESVCVVVNPEDVAKLPPPPKTIEGATVTGELPYAKNNFENFVNYEKDVDERFESGKRKPHTVFITNEIKVNQNRGDTWKKFIQLANDSVGKKQVMIPGYGKIYLRRVRLNPEKEILYSHEQFDHDKSKKMPIGVFLIKRTAFDKAWTKIAQQ